MYWHARIELKNGRLRIDVKNSDLEADLTSVKYEMPGDKTIQKESKDKIKQRIGRSPDFADGFCYVLLTEVLNEH